MIDYDASGFPKRVRVAPGAETSGDRRIQAENSRKAAAGTDGRAEAQKAAAAVPGAAGAPSRIAVSHGVGLLWDEEDDRAEIKREWRCIRRVHAQQQVAWSWLLWGLGLGAALLALEMVSARLFGGG